ncbi:MAG: methyltransferase domain-containing protein [Betaproteobacteria bacterium]
MQLNASSPESPFTTYEQYFVPAMFQPWAAALLRRAGLKPNERVLDVACGTGIVSRQAAPLVGEGGRVVGLDMNAAMLSVARSLARPAGAEIVWQEGNAMSLPFDAESFDVVLCQHGMQFFPDLARSIREMHRVLAQDGRAVAMVLQGLDRHPVFKALMESVARHLAIPLSAVMTPFSLSNWETLKTHFISAGFKEVTHFQETIEARFPEPPRFVPRSVLSSAAAIPAFAALEPSERAGLIAAVAADLGDVMAAHLRAGSIAFPMFAHVAVANK